MREFLAWLLSFLMVLFLLRGVEFTYSVNNETTTVVFKPIIVFKGYKEEEKDEDD